MDIKNIKIQFLNEVVDAFTYENEQREELDKKPHDIPWMISVLDEYLISDFKDFLMDINERGYELNGFEEVCPEHTDAILSVLVYQKDYKKNIELDPNYYNKPYWTFFDYEYNINFSTIFDGYLDYFKPSIEITKVISLGTKEWNKGEDSLNKYISKYKESSL